MNLKGLAGGLYAPLSPKDIETIHDTSLTILEKTGFGFEEGLDETIDLLEANGATVDRDRSRIFISRNLVMEQTRKAPEQVIAETLRVTEPRRPDFHGDPREQTQRQVSLDNEFAAGRLRYFCRDLLAEIVGIEKEVNGERRDDQQAKKAHGQIQN